MFTLNIIIAEICTVSATNKHFQTFVDINWVIWVTVTAGITKEWIWIVKRWKQIRICLCFISCCIVCFCYGIQEVASLMGPFLLSRVCQAANWKSVAIFTSNARVTKDSQREGWKKSCEDPSGGINICSESNGAIALWYISSHFSALLWSGY